MSFDLPKKFSDLAPVVLRLGLAAVYIWFGVSQFANPNMWTSLVPAWASGIFGLSSTTVVHLNGIFEVIAGALLAFGIGVRLVSGLLFVHLLIIASHLGIGPVGVRDFGLSFATLALFLFGEDEHCLFAKRDPFPTIRS
jgi:uncharacterized membrane protein YphA (DoxX/SURF4 family)